ncbi:MAG: large subunit ribosomal protein L23 [Candidatus Promineifilaceae bacterium]|jgi:large subunit ribosomal protein L23
MKSNRIVIQEIQFTEKSAVLSEDGNKYFFKVEPSANKVEIRAAVEQLYKVKVAAVNTMRCRGKMTRKRTATPGRTSDWKRAVVTLQEGHVIDAA